MMRKFLFVSALALTVTLCAPTVTDAGERQCPKAQNRGPVQQFVANVAERWKARADRVGRFACEVAATVRPVVLVSFVNDRPTIKLTYSLSPVAGICVNGRCGTAGK